MTDEKKALLGARELDHGAWDMERNIACAANAILWLWNEIEVEASAQSPWYRLPERQAYRQAMNIMVNNHLIDNFDVVKVRVKINGHWRTDRQEYEFADSGPKTAC